MSFLKAADLADIPQGKMKSVKVGGKEILLANVAGSFHAMDNKCSHAHAPLSRGKLDDCVITCPLHHAKFDVRDGKNISDAQILFIKMKAKDMHTYPVQMDGTSVMVDVG